MHTTTATQTVTRAGAPTELLSGILGMEIRNEEKITAQDRIFCERQQELLYKTLDQIDRWYGIFTEEAMQYRESHGLVYKKNGELKFRSSANRSEHDEYTRYAFKPFNVINGLASANLEANEEFAIRIITYFNRTYNVSVSVPTLSRETLGIGFRPQYMTYVDIVIRHLGGRSFRQTAEEELLKRFHKLVKPGRWSKVKPELKGDKISFPNVIAFDDFYYDNYRKNHVHYNYYGSISSFCEGIAFGSDNILCGDSGIVPNLDQNDVDISRWYNLTTTNATGMRLFRNGRIDVRFKDREAAGLCFNRLRLDELRLYED